jgi:hypothetical protein
MASQPQPPSAGQPSNPEHSAPPGQAASDNQAGSTADPAAQAAAAPAGAEPPRSEPGFATRRRMLRRIKYLRQVRELSYRDLGGLMFDLHRFGGRRDELLIAKLTRLSELDGELRALEKALDHREPVTVLEEAGVVACLRCAAIHSSDDHFCPHCGMSVSRDAERPLTTAPETPIPGQSSAAATPPPAAPPTPPASAPAAAPSASTPPAPQPPAPPKPSVPRQPPVAARLSGLSGDPEATSMMPAAAAGSKEQEAGEEETPKTTPQQADGASDQGQASADEPTQVLKRPERPEGSTTG